MDFSLSDATRLLARTPDVVSSLVGGLPGVWSLAKEADGRWSPVEIVAHLIHGERDDWLPRLRIVREFGRGRPFEPFVVDEFRRELKGEPIVDLIQRFRALRAANLDDLARIGLQDADLERLGEHPAFGAVTAKQLIATWVAHDFSHVRQIARVLAKHYRAEVGPWREYLPVMSE